MTEPIVLDDAPITKPLKVDKILESIMSRIAPAEVKLPTLKVLIYGSAGVGKTTFAGTAPKPLVIDVERGSRSLLNVNNPVDVLEFRSIDQVEATVQYLKNGNPAFDKYDTIVLDSITEMQARLIDQQLREMGGGYKLEWSGWSENSQRIRMLINSFRDIEKNLICVAHDKLEKDDLTGLTIIKPQLTPALSKTIAGIFDIVAYLRIDSKGQRVLRLQPTKTILAKSRLSLPEEIVNPTWNSIAI